MSEEVRVLTNTALAAMIGDTESQDALRLEKLRLKWERRPFPKVVKKKIAATAKRLT